MKRLLKIIGVIFINVSPIFAQVTGLSGWNIFLDPGHSQKENMGIYGYSEAERNLRVGLRLQEFLLNTTDIDTVYISRTDDQRQVSLENRTDYANRVGAAWFHSIHSDAGAPEYNSTLLLWGQYYNGREKIPNGGNAMSDIMVDILTRGMRTNTRGSIGDCTFYSSSDWCRTTGGPYLHVNRETTMPSELSEAGFHTNPRQNQLFMNADWKKLEAKTFYWSILKFHGIERPFVGTCVGIITDKESGVPVNGAQIALNGQTYTTDSYESLFYKYSNNPDQLHNGFYYFENLPDGTFPMTVTADDYYGDTLTVSIVDTFFTFKDVQLISRIPPYVVSTTPASGDTNFPAWDEIIFNFSRPMNATSVQNNFAISPEANGAFSWSNNYNKMNFRPDSLTVETNYTITISGNAQDKYCHFFDGNGDGIGGDEFAINFKTGPADMFPPQPVAIYPPSNALNVEQQPIIQISFDEQVDSATIVTANFLKLERFRDKTAVDGKLEHYVVNEQSVVCFFPTEKLFPEETYTIKINPGFKDLFGNEALTARAFRFKTAGYDYEIKRIDDFEASVTSNWWQPQQSGSTGGIVTEKTSRQTNCKIVNLLTESSTSLQIDYGWDPDAGSWLIRVFLGGGTPRSVLFNKNYLMQVYIFGDGSGNQFRFCVDDNVPNESAQNHEVSPWFTIDWIGWKAVTWDMATDGTGAWLGDGRLDGTLRFDSIQLTYTPGSTTSGIVYIDDLQLITRKYIDVEIPLTSLPADYLLYQNYPNPFNLATTIHYQVPMNNHHVNISVYDILGKKVKTLIDENQPAGEYSIQWNGTDENGIHVASGTYLCKMSSGDFNQIIRMILIK